MKEKDIQETDSGLYLMDGDIDPDIYPTPDAPDAFVNKPACAIRPEFKSNAPTTDQIDRINTLRAAYSNLRDILGYSCKSGVYTSLACTALEESCMWATKGITLD